MQAKLTITKSDCKCGYHKEGEGMISEISNTVENACRSEKNKFGYGIWSHHIISVVEYSLKLAGKTRADKEIVEIAALLHDYASIIDYEMYKEHHLHGAEEATRILKAYGYPDSKTEIVRECIKSHRGSVPLKKSSKEAVCIADADAIAHIVNVPSLLCLTYKEKEMEIEEGKEFVRSKLQRSWQKLSDEAKDLINAEYEAALLVLK